MQFFVWVLLSPHFIQLVLSPPLIALPLYTAEQLERCLLSYPEALTVWKHYNYSSLPLNIYTQLTA